MADAKIKKPWLKSNAVISDDKIYRYQLTRSWDPNKKSVCFIGVNPSTAAEQNNDPTVSKLISASNEWGYGGLVIYNLFAFRSPSPAQLEVAQDPIGPENDIWLRKAAADSAYDKVIAIWGNEGEFRRRGQEVSAFFPHLWCLAKTKSGNPTHPLYLPLPLQPQPYP